MPRKNNNTAEQSAEIAWSNLKDCLDNKQSFLFEAGAGAGKTYSLIESLQYLIGTKGDEYRRQNQKIACITFTNVAKEEIESRTDKNPLIFTDTIHAFCWSIIERFQPAIKDELLKIGKWSEKIESDVDLSNFKIKYDLGYPRLSETEISLSHDDVIEIAALFLAKSKFRSLIVQEYPVILIDEYQDTNTLIANSIVDNLLGSKCDILIGFFGDHWQKIYGDGCGAISNKSLKLIEKNSNFRSQSKIVELLNVIRPELTQEFSDGNVGGEILAVHTNNWGGERQKGSHWKGDLPPDEAQNYTHQVITKLSESQWNFSNTEETKVLMLTHNILAAEQGYSNLVKCFKHNDQFIKKENAYISFFADTLEPIVTSYESKEYGKIFSILGKRSNMTEPVKNKAEWKDFVGKVNLVRENGTIKDMIDLLNDDTKVYLPEKIIRTEMIYAGEIESEQDVSYLADLHLVKYKEVIALCNFINGYTPFSTKHSVKGAEYEDVFIVVGRGWNKYNFDEMISQYATGILDGREELYERSRNLFYVSCSRAKNRLVILFTQELSNDSLRVLDEWFGAENVIAVEDYIG